MHMQLYTSPEDQARICRTEELRVQYRQRRVLELEAQGIGRDAALRLVDQEIGAGAVVQSMPLRVVRTTARGDH